MPLHVTVCSWVRAVGRKVANMDNWRRQVDDCFLGLWLQNFFRALCLILYPPLDPHPRVVPGCPGHLVSPPDFFGSPPYSDHCPSTSLSWVVSCSSRSPAGWTEHQAGSPRILVLSLAVWHWLCLLLRLCFLICENCESAHDLLEPFHCCDSMIFGIQLVVRNTWKYSNVGKCISLPAHSYIFNNVVLCLSPQKWVLEASQAKWRRRGGERWCCHLSNPMASPEQRSQSLTETGRISKDFD